MNKIIKLSPELISQIAAGEIVERPSSIIKELLENSIDAGATSITILLEKSGLSKITIIDNGHGMTPVDIKLAIQSHTTSKVIDREDLLGISTFGFRGEALGSISQISQLTVNSRINTSLNSDSLGYSLQISGGEIESFDEIGMAKGTKIVVENIFFNMPARKKFLKSNRVELNHCIDAVVGIALGHSEIKFVLKHNKKNILDLPKQTIQERIKTILGKKIYSHALEIEKSGPYFKLNGIITNPQIGRSTTSKQYLYVNNRRVKDKKLSSTVKKTYASLLPKDVHPPFVLFISAPFETVDVNIHPKKSQVSFTNPKSIHYLLEETIKETLSNNNLIFTKTVAKDSDEEDDFGKKYLYPKEIAKSAKYTLKDSGNLKNTKNILKKSTDTWITKLKNLPSSEIMQLDKLYLVTTTDEGLLIFDQHAVHERILYEQFLEEFKNQRSKPSIKLENPLKLELPFIDARFLLDNIEVFKKQGFKITSQKHDDEIVFTVLSAPAIFVDRADISYIIIQVLSSLRDDDKSINIDNLSHQLITSLSCKTAIKAGDYLEPEERKRLLERLETCQNPYTCPHGRPTKISMPVRDLNRLFKRS